MRRTSRLILPPSVGAQVDPSGPYANGLIAAGTTAFNVNAPGRTSSWSQVSGAGGIPTASVMPGGGDSVLFGNGAVYNAIQYSDIVGGGAPPLTYLCEAYYVTVGSGNYGLIDFGGAFDTSGYALMLGGSSGKMHLDAPSTNWTSTQTITAGKRYVFAISLSAASTTPICYINGFQDVGSGSPSGTTIATAPLTIGVELNGASHQAITNGYIGVTAVWNRVLEPELLRRLSLNPYELFQSRPLVVRGRAAAGVTVAVTGVQGTGQIGSVTVSAAANVTVAGVAGTSSLGAVTESAAATAPVTGVSGTSSLGSTTETAAANVALSGVAGTTALGSPTVAAAASTAVTGVSGTSALGAVTETAAATAPVSLQAATGAPGAVVATAPVYASPAGLSAGTSVGTVTLAIGRYVYINWDMPMSGKVGQPIATQNKFGIIGALTSPGFTGDQASNGSGWVSTPLL